MRPLVVCILFGLARSVAAGELPIITLGDNGPDQEVPTDRSFYVRGDVAAGTLHAQAIVVRRGSPSLFGDSGPSCGELIANLDLESSASAGGDDEDDEDDLEMIPTPRYDAGVHRGFEIFPYATGSSRRAEVLVTAAWQRRSGDERQFNVLVPHDRNFFSAGYGYCLAVVTTEHEQTLDDVTLTTLIDGVASKIVACGDKTSCDEDALADYGTNVARALAAAGTMRRTPGKLSELSSLLTDAARSELGSATGIVEVIGHMSDRFFDKTSAMPPVTTGVWLDVATDPFAHAVAELLSHAGVLLPQIRGTTTALYTADGKVSVRMLQLLEDGRSIRVAASMAPAGNQASVLNTTTDQLEIADDITLYDLIQLGERRLRVDQEWITLRSLGEGLAQIGRDQWTTQDTAFLANALAQLQRLSDFIDLSTSGVTCGPAATLDNWLACHKPDTAAIETMREQLAALVAADLEWRATREKLVARSRRIVTLTSTMPMPLRLSFESSTWVFSYVTPIVGYAGVLRPDETFGLFYVGAQIHLDPNPINEVPWRNGVTTKDLRRAIALELGVAPYRTSFGPDMRYDGPGELPALFVGAAVHVLPYTSLTLGAAIVERRNSTLREEQAHTVVSPYIGITIQLNVPDLIRQAMGPSTDTTASR